jgi:hypothetical protein
VASIIGVVRQDLIGCEKMPKLYPIPDPKNIDLCLSCTQPRCYLEYREFCPIIEAGYQQSKRGNSMSRNLPQIYHYAKLGITHVRRLAEYVPGVSVQSMAKYMREGRFPGIKINGHWHVDVDGLEEMINVSTKV